MSRPSALGFARLLCLLLALAALLGSVGLIVARTAFWITATSAQGTVVGWQDMDGSLSTGGRISMSRAYAAGVEFMHNGETVVFVADWGSESRPYERGETVTVLYDPDAPQDAMIRGFMSMYLGPLLLLPLAGVFALAALILDFARDSRGGRLKTARR